MKEVMSGNNAEKYKEGSRIKGRPKQRDIVNIFNTTGCCLHDSNGLYEKMIH